MALGGVLENLLGGNWQAYITLIVLFLAMLFYVTEAVSIIITSMAIPIVLALTGVITADEAFLGFSNSNVILFVSMFIVGGAMFKTGLAKRLGEIVIKFTSGNEKNLLIGVWIIVSLTSAFLSNTGCVAVFLPVCLGIADSAGWNRKNILMMLAMTASTGGMITLVGTPPNITINAILQQYGYQPLGFFEFAWIGIPINVLCSWWLIGTSKTTEKSIGENVWKGKFEKQSLSGKEMIAVGVMVAVIIVMACGIFPLHIASALGALVCVLCGLLTEKEAIESVDWTTILLFAGTLTLADALDKTGAGKLIANTVVKIIGHNENELFLLTVVFLVTAILTQIMSNTAICALMAPIGIQIAEVLHAKPQGVLVVIAIAASAAFATPMATPPNTLVMGAGDLEIKDFLKRGIPLVGISYVVTAMIVPHLWPLY